MVIGMGSFGLVWKASVSEGEHAGKAVAIKIIDLDQFEDMSLAEMRKEIAVMNTSKHKNIVGEFVSFISGTHLYIVMEMLDAGSCMNVIKQLGTRNNPGIADEAVIATILRETMLGLQYLHKSGKVHRDIKCGNILLNMQGDVFLSDFGVSANIKKGVKRDTLVGSPCWMAPEVMN